MNQIKQSGGRSWRIFSAVIFLYTFFIPLRLLAQGDINQLNIAQYDRYDAEGKLVFANSALAEVNFTAPRLEIKQAHYLNLFAKTVSGDKEVWLTENYPVLPGQNILRAICISVSVDLRLINLKPGEKAHEITYAYTLTSSPVKMAKARGDAFSARQYDSGLGSRQIGAPLSEWKTVKVAHKKLINGSSAFFKEDGPPTVSGMSDAVAKEIYHEDMPDVEEGINQCLPGSFARSIAWLNQQNNLGLNKTAQEIFDDLVDIFDDCPGNDWNSYMCRIDKKRQYLDNIAPGSTTTSSLPSNICGYLDNQMGSCDVELDFGWPNGGAHIVTVSGYVEGADGCCYIYYRDDSEQGQPGGACEKFTRVCNGYIDYYSNGQWQEIRLMISECVPGTARTTRAEPDFSKDFMLLQNTPNPFGNSTRIAFNVTNAASYKNVAVVVRNEAGRQVARIPVQVAEGLNQVPYQPGKDLKGVLYYSVEVNGQIINTKKMMVLPQQE
jgi:hypothetical protein